MLHRHLKTIVFAIKENRSQIPNDPELRAVINDLKSANLGYLIDGSKSFLIREVVVTTIRVFENQGGNRVGASQVAGLLDNLEEYISDYFELKLAAKTSASDIDLSWAAIVDVVKELSGILLGVFSDYARHIFKDLNRFNSYKIKIKKVERAIKEAGKLENIVSTLTIERITELSRGERELYELLRTDLYSTVGACLDSFTYSCHELRHAMGRWQIELERGIKRNELVDDLGAYFTNGGSLDVLIDKSLLPVVCTKPFPKRIKAYADFSVMDSSPYLSRFAQQILPALVENQSLKQQREQHNRKLMEEEVVGGEGELAEIELPYIKALSFMFMTFAHASDLKVLSAVEAHRILKPEVDLGYWLSQIGPYWSSNQSHYANYSKAGNLTAAQHFAHFDSLRLVYVEHQDVMFNGNLLVQDVLIKRK